MNDNNLATEDVRRLTAVNDVEDDRKYQMIPAIESAYVNVDDIDLFVTNEFHKLWKQGFYLANLRFCQHLHVGILTEGTSPSK